MLHVPAAYVNGCLRAKPGLIYTSGTDTRRYRKSSEVEDEAGDLEIDDEGNNVENAGNEGS
jgi:hypothetical protein